MSSLAQVKVATTARRRRSPRRWIGLIVMAVGIALLAGTAANFMDGLLQEHQLDQSWINYRVNHEAPTPTLNPDPAWLHPVNGVDFAIAVPKLNYLAAVREGVSSDTLAAGPGHYPSMKWPGQQGNVGVAAHNIYWIHFDQLQSGDEIVLQTRWGDYHYRIQWRKLVSPDDMTVLVPTSDYRLTLTTCWPLWAGAFATQRLIFSAEMFYPAQPPA
ncbi:MAG TPA: class D sortase [Candidatus Dormibacteraeota bacterium]